MSEFLEFGHKRIHIIKSERKGLGDLNVFSDKGSFDSMSIDLYTKVQMKCI